MLSAFCLPLSALRSVLSAFPIPAFPPVVSGQWSRSPWSRCPWSRSLVVSSLFISAFCFLLSAFPSPAALPDIPRLDWQPRSDWINVQTDVTPGARGDGRADDTAPLQAALNRGVTGKTVYLPRGTYRITQTLAFHSPETGAAIIGHGRDTRLVWDGATGERMFWSDGAAYCRYVGLVWDGRGRAAVGFDHASQKRFETEISHEHEAFRNFTAYGIRVGNQQKVASAEILYRNCLFQNCGTALGLLTFNDYDNTLDRCEFRNCGAGIVAHKSNFYVRNCHFENSRDADFVVGAEHGCSIRRCTSSGSKQFIRETGTVAPLTVQDCHIAGWTDPVAAVQLDGSPVLMFDCSFTPASSNRIPVKAVNASQKLLLSNNQPAPIERLVTGIPRDKLYVIPPGRRGGAVTAAGQRFLQESVPVPTKVFDAVRDFGAKGDGRTDDSAAIQSAIDAARQQAHSAIAYLPGGRYAVARSLSVTGRDYTLGGSGFRCGLLWRGEAGQPLIVVSNAQNLTLANFMVGHSDLGPMNHGDDILVTSPADQPCRLFLDCLYAFGIYQKLPDRHGIHFDRLPAGSVIDAGYVQGNLRITDCPHATLLFRTAYEGTVTLEGAPSAPDGFAGFLTRLATETKPALRVLDNNSVVMSDFYVEEGDQVAVIKGAAGQPPGRVTIQGPKMHLHTQEPVFDIADYSGQVYYGQTQMYCDPQETVFRLSGARPVRLILAGDFWYNNRPVFKAEPSAQVVLAGNSGAPDSTLGPPELAAIAAALDDLRRLGALDLHLPTGIER